MKGTGMCKTGRHCHNIEGIGMVGREGGGGEMRWEEG